MIYSTYFKPIFWTVMGLLYALVIAGAPVWGADLGLSMTWWKWMLAGLWYLFVSYSLAGAFTLLGESEPGAWYKFLVFHLSIAIIFGVGLWLLF